MRPRQWVKNAFVFAPLVFDGQTADVIARTTNTILAFVLLCAMSSAVYLMNDLADLESDRQHPVKRNRPLPAGQLAPRVAQIAAVVLGVGSLAVGLSFSWPFGLILLAYFLIQVAYTFYLKHIVLLDVITVASGFVLRVGAGVVVIEVSRFSPWLYVCTALGALFLALGKRRHELVLLGRGAGTHRAILEAYTLEFVDRLIGIVTTSALVAYGLYTFLADNLPDNHSMMLTIPVILYVLFRLLYLMMVKGEGGAPEDILLQDRPLQAALLVWCIMVVLFLYVVG